MSDKIAFCGIICSECPAFVAKKTNDDELRKKTAEKWSTEEWPLNPDNINCDGCTTKGELAVFCTMCEVRTCGTEKGVINCAYCTEYPCKNLEMPWSQSPQAKEVLDNIRKTQPQ